MALINSFETSGNKLFRYRGQIPTLLFVAAIPVVYFTDYTNTIDDVYNAITLLSVILSIAGLFIRAFTIGTTPKGTSGRNTKEQLAETLNVTGVYSVVRHPLYLGNYLIWIGITAFTFNLYFFLLISLFFWLYYERIMFAEERFLERKFGDKYIRWSETVPAFIPALFQYKKSVIPFSFKSVLRREYSGFVAVAFGFAYIDLLRLYFAFEVFEWQRFSIYILIFTTILALILRFLKHNNLLNEKGRS